MIQSKKMGHHHHHERRHGSKGMTLAFWLNLSFSIFEIIGGLWTNSTAIIADAFHDFMDALAIGMAVFFEKFSQKKGNNKYSYGYRRFSLLSALILSASLLVGASFMVYGAIYSFFDVREVNGKGMFIMALIGIAVNGFAFLRIRKEESNNNNQRAVMLHLLEDVLGWVAILVGSIIIYFTGWNWIDGVLTLGIAGFIGYNAVINLIQTMKVLLQYVPVDVDINTLKAQLLLINGIKDIHDLHVWSLDGDYTIASMHVVVESDEQRLVIRQEVSKLMASFNIQHPTIQMEVENELCDYCDCDLEE